MATKRPRRPRDPNVLAKLIVDMATGEVPREPERRPKIQATQAQRKGGLKETLRVTPAMEAGVADHVGLAEEIIHLAE